jgi:outer membrane autotransporter protein
VRSTRISCISVLLAATALVAPPAWGAGGTGGNGSPDGEGGTGGSSLEGTSAAAGTGTALVSGGGGGGGAAGGSGGNGGAGGGTGGGAGINGTDGVAAGSGGGGGGGGTIGTTTVTLINDTGISGGNAGSGGAGEGSAGAGGGGGGGEGGYGAVVTGSGASSNSSPGAIVGGTGGAGGASGGGTADGGNGGSGGIGIHFTSSAAGATFTNSGTVVGGTGGAAGTGGLVFGGQGGVGVVGEGLTIVNGGTISRGTNGAGSLGLPANAITFTSGTNVLELRSTSIITGVVQAGSADTLRLGGTTAGSFNVSNIGLQYRDFGQFEKTGTSTWTLTGSTSTTTNWRVSAGTLEISSEGNLGGAGSAVVLGGGTLRTTGDFTISRLMLLDGGTNTVNTAGGTELTWSGLIDGPGSLRKAGNGILILEGAKTYSGGTTVAAGTLQLGTAGGSAGSVSGALTVAFAGSLDVANGDLTGATIANTGFTSIRGSSTAGTATIDNNGFLFVGENGSAGSATINNAGSITFSESASAGSANIVTLAGGFLLSFADSSTAANATITVQNGSLVQLVNGSGGQARFIIEAGGQFDMSGGVANTAGSIEGGGDFFLGANQLTVGSNNLSANVSGTINDGGSFGGTGASLVKVGTGTLTLSGANTYTGGTTINAGALSISADNNLGDTAGPLALNGGTLQITAAGVMLSPTRAVSLGAGGGTFDVTQSASISSGISGAGGLTKTGAGTLSLGGANTYSGGTTVNAGTLQLLPGASLSAGGALTVNGGTFNTGGNNLSVGVLSGSGGVIAMPGGVLTADSASNTTLAAALIGTGSLVKQGSGLLNLTGANTYTGPTSVNAGTLAVNGSITSNVTVGASATLGGSGTIAGTVSNAGTLAPGNSIGTLTMNGSYAQAAGSTYQVEVNAAGQGDRINVTGTPGSATISGGTVQVLAATGTYGRSTTYTILNATGGVSGAYSSVTSNFAFLTPSLSYDPNNVFLTLSLGSNAFSFGGNTPNQRAVGAALDASFSNATGDFATVLSAMAGLSSIQGPLALDAISGQQYADFGTTNVANASLFMNTLGQQMALARRGSAPGSRIALAQACEVEACDEARPLSAWFSGLGGLGSVQGDGNSSTLTYNVGGAAAGIDYRFDPRFLVGLGVGYTHGTQWVNSFTGQGWTDSVSVAAYGSFAQAGFYADALVGYAYLNNQMQRQIQIPGLQQRTASGSTGANQFLAQVETGYKLGVWTMGSLTPFARFQTSSTTQNAFTESGASSLNLNVAQQTTNSVRTVLGAEFGSSIPLGTERALGLSLRLGWQHEYAYTGRPITSSFAGAPTVSFTVYGATPTRDAAIVGFSATASIATATQLYLRYDGELASGTDNHALTVGLRMSW